MSERKILLVDDDELVLATFSRGLRSEGFEMRVAGSGEEALEAVRREAPDLVILDIRMPGLSGLETAERLQAQGIPCMFLSAYGDRDLVEDAVRRGALGYLVKPVDAGRAVPAIEAALERARDIRDLKRNRDRLSGALDTGSQVNVALGILMERYRFTRQEAFDRLRARARSERRKIRDVAADLLDAWDLINSYKPATAQSSRQPDARPGRDNGRSNETVLSD